MFQDLSRRSIETGFFGFETRLKIKFGLCILFNESFKEILKKLGEKPGEKSPNFFQNPEKMSLEKESPGF